jgi:peptide/nickel transport system permease protein
MSLRRFIAKRLLLVVPILFGVSIVTFLLVELAPGNPLSGLIALNPDLTEAEKAQIYAEYGLNDPIYERYLRWIRDVIAGDLGTQLRTGRSVNGIIERRLPKTIALGVFAWVIALLVALPTGIYAAVNKDQFGDEASRFIALSGISLPNFWLGLMLLTLGAGVLNLWPVTPSSQKPVFHPDILWYLLLPGLTIGTASASNLMRVTRTSVVEELNKEYVTTARAKGLPERTVILKHVLRNSLISVITLAAFLTTVIISGSIVVEQVFNWPGLGLKFIEAVNNREVDLIMALTLINGTAIVIANLLADIAYAIVDPRIRY